MDTVGLVILTGGNSRRMGQKKELLNVGGETFLARICRELSPLCDERFLSVNASQDYQMEGYISLRDAYPDAGPMGGICTALSNCTSDALLAIACDMPFYGIAQARFIIDAWHREHAQEPSTRMSLPDLVVPLTDTHPQMLAAVYGKTCLPVMEELIAFGQYRLQTLIKRLTASCLTQADESAYRSINTPEEYKEYLQTEFSKKEQEQ